jgi:glycerol kinase
MSVSMAAFCGRTCFYYNARVLYLLSLDEGTTTARAALYDGEGRRLAMETSPIQCFYPHDGWVEQDAGGIWHAQLDAALRVLAASGVNAAEVSAIGITNQRETTIVWDRSTGRPIAPAIVWQCRRTSEDCRRIAGSPAAERITALTGLVVDAYFSASKIRWILDHTPGARERAHAGDLLFGNVDTWLIWNLTGGRVHATDPTNASRTMLMNLESGDWDSELLELFDVPRAMLPVIVPSCGVLGECEPSLFGAPVAIAGVAGDQQAALVGQAAFRPGLSKNTYGTGCFALMHTGSRAPRSRSRLLGTRAASPGGASQFAIEGSIFVGGAAVQWLRDQLGLVVTAAETEAVAGTVPDTGGVYLVPAFVGLGAPHWNPDARGLLCGMTRSTSRAHLVRAALESIAYQTVDLARAMEADTGERLRELRVDGGAADNDFLMQFQADVLDCPIVRPADAETTALGAAYLAGLATGVWKSASDLESFWQVERVFEPRMPASRREALLDGWRSALRRALYPA